MLLIYSGRFWRYKNACGSFQCTDIFESLQDILSGEEKKNPARYRKCVYNASFCLREGENENTEYIGGDVCILIADSLLLYSWNQYNIVKQLSSNLKKN